MTHRSMASKWGVRCTLLALVVALVATLAGCGVQLTYTTKVTTAGARELTLSVALDDTADQVTRDSTYALLQQIEYERKAKGRNTVLSNPDDNSYCLTESFDSATDYYIAIGYTGNEPNEVERDYTPMGYFVEYRSELRPADAATVASYALRYANIADDTMLFDWRDHVADLAAGDDALAVVAAPLTAASTDTLLDATIGAISTTEALADHVLQWLAARGYDAADLQVTYIYDHLYDSVYAKQYDEKYEKEGCTAYVWHLTADQLATASFAVYQKAPRVWAWEVTAIAVGVVVAIAIWLVILAKRRVKNAPTEQGQKED